LHTSTHSEIRTQNEQPVTFDSGSSRASHVGEILYSFAIFIWRFSEEFAAVRGTGAAQRSDASFLNIVCQFWQFIDDTDAFIVDHIASRGTGSHSGRSKDRPRLAVLFAESTIFRQMGKMLQVAGERNAQGLE